MTMYAHVWRRRPRGDRGSVTVFAVAAFLGVVIVAGLAVDGSRAAQAAARAQAVAAEAARAGGQSIDPAAAIRGEEVVDPAAAVAAAQTYLAAAAVPGTVQVVGNQLVVDVTVTSDTTLLALVDVDGFSMTGHAVADLIRS